LKNQFSIGEPVEVIKTHLGGHNKKKSIVIKKGKVYQVCKRFVTIDFGYYRESFDIERVRKAS
jgi:uncharacterized protein YvpB